MNLILTDTAVQRQVLLERFKAAETRKFVTVIRQIDEEIRRQLSGGRITDFRRSRLETQLAGIKRALRGQYSEYIGVLNQDLQSLAIDSARWEAGVFRLYAPTGVSIATPAPQQLWSAVQAQPLSMHGPHGGSLLESFMDSWAEGDSERVVNSIRLGYSLGETNDEILGRIRGQAQLNYADGVLATNRAHAETTTRTAIQHVANSARAETWAANDDIIEQYQIVATLDSRTSTVCRNLDGDRYPVGKGPMPPFHPNCRTTTAAVLTGDFGRFLEEEETRASVNGQVPADETYYTWLGRQDAAFQDLALGPKRAKLFRDGGLSSEEFARLQLGKNFEPLSLAEMRKLKPKAFRRAGL